MILHLSVGRQTFIEDCEVCCEPIESSFTEQEDELGSFQANTLGYIGKVLGKGVG